MISEFLLGGDGIYRCDGLIGFEFSRHGFGTRLSNPPADVTLRQIHSAQIYDARGLEDRQLEGDALVCIETGRSIGVRTADCVPMLLLDPETHAIGAVHAGWRGSVAGIAGKTVARLTEEFEVFPANLRVAIGPCIRECCYEVGPEVAGQFVSQFPEWGGEVRRRHLNLPEANRRDLIAAGVSDQHIFDSGLCTACSPDLLFSFRREPQNPGRMISAISRLF